MAMSVPSQNFGAKKFNFWQKLNFWSRPAYTEQANGQATSANRSFNAANQLLTATEGNEVTDYTYDNKGNLLSAFVRDRPWDTGYSYEYDQRNLLVSVLEHGVVVHPLVDYTYDGSNNRVQQVIYENGTLAATITYTNDILGMTQVLLADDGTTTTANLFGLDLISQGDGTQTRFLLADGLGSARTEMVGGTVETTTTYEPYGRLLAQTGSSGTTYGFTGEQEDAATGLVYLRARYYNPYLNQFQSRDPFPGYGTLPASQNGYNYVHGNPVNHTDPSGRIINPLTPFGRGTIIHKMVQAKYATSRPTHVIDFEYIIPNASLSGDIRVMLCEQSSGQPFYAIVCNNPSFGSIIDNASGKADIIDWTESSLYEIKSIRTPKSIGILTAQWYILNYNEAQGLDMGIPLFPGQGFGPTQIIGTDPANPGSWIFAQQDAPGLITYWERPKDRTQPQTVPTYVYEWDPGLQKVQERSAYVGITPSYGSYGVCQELPNEIFWAAAGGYLLWNLKGCVFGPWGCALDLVTPGF